jgi:hypothetical protein
MFVKYINPLINKYFFIIFCFFVAILINNTIPYISLPTLGQALWAMGYAKSISNGGLLNVYALDFGIPQPAAIAFGLSAVLPMGWLIKLGMLPEAAYSFIFSLWLALAFWGAYKFAVLLSNNIKIAPFYSLLWLITPIITKHAGYSMLMLGIALLPFYCWCAFNFIFEKSLNCRDYIFSAALFLAAALISIFMDGYTFVMFAVASSFMFLFAFLNVKEKKVFICVKLPVFFVVFSVAYFLYSHFIGKSSYQAESLDFFRGWGVDLSFLIIPSKGVFWFFDYFGWSKQRLFTEYFGDSSVWDTTFSIPFVLLGLLGWWKCRSKSYFINCLFVIGVFSLYMALGPSFKFFSTKPDGYVNLLANTMLMPEKYALFPTGNSMFSENLPGFNVMRASYRWMALAIFSFWCLSVSYMKGKRNRFQYGSAVLLFILFLPNVADVWKNGRANYNSVFDINERLVNELKKDIPQGSKVAFIPWGNDFFANYLAPFSGFRSFNIGGDKNLEEALPHWPSVMVNLQGEINQNKINYLTQLLLNKNVDYVVIPYFNMLWSAHYWVCPSDTLIPLNDETYFSLKYELKLVCPYELKEDLKSNIGAIKALPYLNVLDRKLYAVISINSVMFNEYIRQKSNDYPLNVEPDNFALNNVLEKGWYYLEAGHVWSKYNAKIKLSVPNKSNERNNFFVFRYSVFYVNGNDPITVEFESIVKGKGVKITKTIKDNDVHTIEIPIDHDLTSQLVDIKVSNAKSPSELNVAPDTRKLGISLESVHLSN